MGEYVPAGHLDASKVPIGQKVPEIQLLQVEEFEDPRDGENRPLLQGMQDEDEF
jgi:hypothetical protein